MTQTTKGTVSVETRARALHACAVQIAAKHQIVTKSWEEADEAVRQAWRQCVADLDEIGKGIRYE